MSATTKKLSTGEYAIIVDGKQVAIVSSRWSVGHNSHGHVTQSVEWILTTGRGTVGGFKTKKAAVEHYAVSTKLDDPRYDDEGFCRECGQQECECEPVEHVTLETADGESVSVDPRTLEGYSAVPRGCDTCGVGECESFTPGGAECTGWLLGTLLTDPENVHAAVCAALSTNQQ